MTTRQATQPAAIDRIAIGKAAESAAESFLRQNGLRIRHRNFRCRLGEIDLVMMDGDCLVFGEVRFRRPGKHGSGAESITQSKRRKLINSAAWYLRTQKISSHQACRFDVISVGLVNAGDKAGDNAEYEFDWIQDAFQSEY